MYSRGREAIPVFFNGAKLPDSSCFLYKWIETILILFLEGLFSVRTDGLPLESFFSHMLAKL